ncbi:MAG TPA: SusE domain-containing protein [Puia sp.]|nr:SusE domain-containing protein [Puia sp.]
MKKLYGLLFLISALGLLFTGCKRDLANPVLISPSGVTGFGVSASTVVLSSANDSTMVAKFSWQKPNYATPVVSTYTLLFDIPSDTSGATGWANAIKVNIATSSLQNSWLGTDFNRLLNQLGLPFGSPSTIVVRLKADVNQGTGAVSTVPAINAVLSMTVTPYKVVLIFPKLYVAGDFLVPNWTQIDQGGWILASVKSDGFYEGYINFVNTGNSFKLCTQASWNGTNYGWGGTATTLSGAGSAGNCYSGGPGYYKVAADVTALTISYVLTKWVVAGDFNNWSLTANPMSFNATTNQWTATGVSMTAGAGYKFVGDGNWTTAFGADSKGNLSYSGGNIAVTKTGTYTVTLDLSGGAGNYSYSLK